MKTLKIILAFILVASLQTMLYSQHWITGVNGGGPNNTGFPGRIAETSDGSKIVTGSYRFGSAIFGSYTLPWMKQSSDPLITTYNSFIVKYSPSNSVVWATRIASIGSVSINSVELDPAGNIYVCGDYGYGVCYFYNVDNVNNFSHHLSNSNPFGRRGFIAKYSANGNPIWVREALTTGTVMDIALNDNGNMLAVTGTSDYPVQVVVGESTISQGAYVHWINPVNGSTIRAYSFANKSGSQICFDHDDNVIVSGILDGVTSYTVQGRTGGDINSITVTSNTNSVGGYTSIYAKYSPNGFLKWAQASRGSIPKTINSLSSIIVDESNNIYISGSASVSYQGSSFQLLLPSSQTSTISIPVSSTTGFIVKLASSNGYASWKNFIPNAVLNLKKGLCNTIYAYMNVQAGSHSYTDADNINHNMNIPQQGSLIYKIATNGKKQSIFPLASGLSITDISTSGKAFIQTVGTSTTNVSLPTANTSVSLNCTNKNIVVATLKDNIIPEVSFNNLNNGIYCSYQNLPLSVDATGASPLLFTWSIYNPASSSFDFVGVSSSPNYSITPATYSSRIFSAFGLNLVQVSVSVTNCSGKTATTSRLFVIKGNISFTPVNNQQACYIYNSPKPNSSVKFTVTAQNADTYSWQFSPNGGGVWYSCSSFPSNYQGFDQATMTVINPQPSQNGYLFRCSMTGCDMATTNNATLTVAPCLVTPINGENSHFPPGGFLAVYPNPANDIVNITVNSPTDNGELTAIIYDYSGRIILRQELQSNRGVISTENFANGYYICKIINTSSETIHQEKFIISH